MRSILTVVLLGLTFMAAAQSAGTLKGKLADKTNKEPLMMATVRVFQGGIFVKGTSTDFDGNYKVTPIEPGTYEVRFEYVGYDAKVIQGVKISPDQTTVLNGALGEAITEIEGVEIVVYKEPLINLQETAKNTSSEEIDQLGETNMSNVVSLSAGVYQKDDGGALNARGSRDDGNVYYIDGVKIIGSNNLPASAIDQISVINGGVPARYGDATGAIINITTKGVSESTNLNIEARTSQFLDAYDHSLGQFTYTTPLFWKKGTITKVGTDEVVKAKDGSDSTGRIRPLVGLFLSGSGEYKGDRSPAAYGVTMASDSVREWLEQNPIALNPLGQGYVLNAESLTADDYVLSKTRPHNNDLKLSVRPKLTFAISDQIDLSFGGGANYQKSRSYIRNYSLINSSNNPINEIIDGNLYGRFTQRLSKQKYDDKGQIINDEFISNAFYTIQLDYSYRDRHLYNPNHKFSTFDYGHVGYFDYDRTKVDFNDPDVYGPAAVFSSAPNAVDTGFLFSTWHDAGLNSFTPSSVNPVLGAYTQYFIDTYDGELDGLGDVQGGQGLLNGTRIASPYSLYNNVGEQYNFYLKQNRQQIRLTVSGNVDLNFRGKGDKKDSVYTHALQFGMEYEQREISNYYINNPVGIWTMMRLYANRHIDVDANNPIQIGNSFGQYENFYLPDIARDNETTFSKNLRAQIGASEIDFINVDNMSPDQFSLDLFSAHELTNASASSTYAYYYGYDYKGNKLASNANITFNDFFTDKENRPIAALKPVYSAFYIQDRFDVNDLLINFGVRADVFDANSMVLKDKFSLYETYKRGSDDSQGADLLANYNHPTNIGDDYVVYVDDFNSPTDVIGYRNGNDWYDASGVQIANGRTLAMRSASGEIQPYLVNPQDDIQSDSYDPTTSFTDYTPQLNIMPRISFRFLLNADALFFAHYDVLTQRPGGLSTYNVATPFDYMYMREIVATSNLGNPDLKPEKTIDYSVGFQQAISESSAIKISAFYREMRNMIHLRRISNAYPVSYKTYDNTDFSTVKGFTFGYDLRRTNNIKITADYTLQFVEGTGSSPDDNEGLIDAISNLADEDPDMKVIHPLTYDQRHTLTTNVDYRFGSGSDYNGPQSLRAIFEDFGANMVFRIGSGTPYSKQAEVTEGASMNSQRSTSEGLLNGSRMPGSFKLDLKIDKGFALKFGKKPQDEVTADTRKAINMEVFVQIKNVLNAKNVIGVYSFTGMADDDGFLASKLGQQKLDEIANAQGSSQPFVDMYNAKLLNPSNFIQPRRAILGVKMNF